MLTDRAFLAIISWSNQTHKQVGCYNPLEKVGFGICCFQDNEMSNHDQSFCCWISIRYYMHACRTWLPRRHGGRQSNNKIIGPGLVKEAGPDSAWWSVQVFRFLRSCLDSAVQWNTICYLKRMVQNPVVFFPEGCSTWNGRTRYDTTRHDAMRRDIDTTRHDRTLHYTYQTKLSTGLDYIRLY